MLEDCDTETAPRWQVVDFEEGIFFFKRIREASKPLVGSVVKKLTVTVDIKYLTANLSVSTEECRHVTNKTNAMIFCSHTCLSSFSKCQVTNILINHGILHLCMYVKVAFACGIYAVAWNAGQ
uniref:Uncharacterized protein tac6058 n=1 Tax=Zea mays TaxID=4577 RepID=Q8W1C8_MAIZE|nr:unknown [Zea mays]